MAANSTAREFSQCPTIRGIALRWCRRTQRGGRAFRLESAPTHDGVRGIVPTLRQPASFSGRNTIGACICAPRGGFKMVGAAYSLAHICNVDIVFTSMQIRIVAVPAQLPRLQTGNFDSGWQGSSGDDGQETAEAGAIRPGKLLGRSRLLL
jgi:hypothetical protein